MKEKNILVACRSLDYVLIQKIISKDFVLNVANSKEEILKLGESQDYDLFLIDVLFLRPDFEVLSWAKERNIPVIALSSEPYDAHDEHMKVAGCCACYIKPIHPKLFSSFIRYWINELPATTI